MKRILLLTIAMILAITVNAQKINIVGTWKEVNPNQYHNQVLNESIVVRTWIFNTDGTKTLKGRQQLTYPIGGINCTFDMVQSRTDEKWTLSGNVLTFTAIPLNKLTIDVDYQKYGNYTAAQKQKINAGIPAFRQQAIKETRQGWQSFVGHTSTYTIRSYNPKQMVLGSDGQEIVLVRDLTKMTAVQKAQFNKELAEYETQIQKEKEMREAAKREAEEKAKREAEEASSSKGKQNQVKFHDVEANQATGPVKSITTNAFGETRTITFSLDGKMQGEDIIDTKYDANGYLQSVKRKVPQGQATITYKWENGKIVSLSMDIIGQQIVTKRTYNEKGAPASESINMGGQDIQTPFTDYKYDNHGNWISRKVSMMGDEMEQTRIINYYE